MSVLSLPTAHRTGLAVFSLRSPRISPFSNLDKCEAESSVASMALCLRGQGFDNQEKEGEDPAPCFCQVVMCVLKVAGKGSRFLWGCVAKGH